MGTKKCKKCKLEKDISLFGVASNSDDGRYGYCKECVNGWKRKWNEKNCDIVKKSHIKYYINNRKKCSEMSKNWRNSPAGKEYNRQNQRKRWVNHREKAIANGMLRYKVWLGEVNKPVACEKCGATNTRICGHHHNGYSKDIWYDVQWLCDRCHHIVHGTLKYA